MQNLICDILNLTDTKYQMWRFTMASVEVNKVAPDFELIDFQGNGFKVSSLKGKKNVLLVLNRGFV